MLRDRLTGAALAAVLVSGGVATRDAAAQNAIAGSVQAGAGGGAGVVGAAASVSAGPTQAPAAGLLGPGAPAMAPVAAEVLRLIRSERWSDPATALRDLAGRRVSGIRGSARDANAIVLLAVASAWEPRPEFWPSLRRSFGAKTAQELLVFREVLRDQTVGSLRLGELREILRNASYEEARGRRALEHAEKYADVLLRGLGAPGSEGAVEAPGLGVGAAAEKGPVLEKAVPPSAPQARTETSGPPSPTLTGSESASESARPSARQAAPTRAGSAFLGGLASYAAAFSLAAPSAGLPVVAGVLALLVAGGFLTFAAVASLAVPWGSRESRGAGLWGAALMASAGMKAAAAAGLVGGVAGALALPVALVAAGTIKALLDVGSRRSAGGGLAQAATRPLTFFVAAFAPILTGFGWGWAAAYAGAAAFLFGFSTMFPQGQDSTR